MRAFSLAFLPKMKKLTKLKTVHKPSVVAVLDRNVNFVRWVKAHSQAITKGRRSRSCLASSFVKGMDMYLPLPHHLSFALLVLDLAE